MSQAERHSGELVKRDDALVGAVVSAAVGLALYGLRKALAAGDEALPDENGHGTIARRSSSLVTAWESAADAILPFADEAAEAAGKWAATSAPALVRERLLPRFIEAFRAA